MTWPLLPMGGPAVKELYSTVTGLYIDRNWNVKSVSLSTSKVEVSHSSENIVNGLENVKRVWNLPNCIAVTNNAVNEKKAFDILSGVCFGCCSHRIYLVVRYSHSGPVVLRLVGKGRK